MCNMFSVRSIQFDSSGLANLFSDLFFSITAELIMIFKCLRQSQEEKNLGRLTFHLSVPSIISDIGYLESQVAHLTAFEGKLAKLGKLKKYIFLFNAPKKLSTYLALSYSNLVCFGYLLFRVWQYVFCQSYFVLKLIC